MIPPGENVAEKKICALSGEAFIVTDKDLAYYDKISPSFADKKYPIPTPNLCPQERDRRRLAWSNEQFLYHRVCDHSGKRILSEYAPNNPRPVWDFRVWNSDAYDPLAYGREIDFSRSLVEQFFELEKVVPHPNVATDMDNENSDYIHQAGHAKDSYLMFHASYIEDCYYGYGVKKAKSCVDSYYCHESEFCYECVDVKGCARVRWSQSCQNCQDAIFLHDCIGCSHCVMCHGLRNKQYCIQNIQYSKDEYEKKLSQLNLQRSAQVDAVRAQFSSFLARQLFRENRNVMTENVFGNYLYSAKDAFHCFDCSDIESCKFCTQLQLGSKDCYDMYQFGINIDHCYETSQTGYNISNCLFSYALVDNCSDLFYCANCFSSKDSLLSYGLKKNQFCILNKQYSESEYEVLAGKCIEKLMSEGQWGEHLDPKYSHIPYNDSMAQQWYPISKDEAESRDFLWTDESTRNVAYEGVTYEPLDIDMYDESAVGDELAKSNIDACLKGILSCQISKRPFRIIAQELAFYIENKIPLPRCHPDVRRQRRFELRDSRGMVLRTCDKCEVEIYVPSNQKGNVCCEECYRKEIY